MKKGGFYNFVKSALCVFFKVVYLAKCEGIDNIPKEGSVLICPNHKSMMDPLLVGGFCPRRMCYMAKKELFNNKILSWFLNKVGAIPIERNEASMDTVKLFISLLKDGNAVTIFPEGTRHCKNPEDVKDGAVMFAIKTKTPIVPTAVIGEFKLFGKVKAVFGEPIYYTEYYGKKVPHDELHKLSIELMNKIYAMVGENNGN